MNIRQTRKQRRVTNNTNHNETKKFGGKKMKKRINKKRPKPPIVFGHIYSPTCGFCVMMKEEWAKLCSKTKIPIRDIGDNYDENVAIFNKEYGSDLVFSNFPTIFRLKKRNGSVEYYTGDRTVNKMRKWLYS